MSETPGLVEPESPYRVGDLVAHRYSDKSWVVSVGSSLDAHIGKVFPVVRPGERWMGWWVALWDDVDLDWFFALSEEERADVDMSLIGQRIKAEVDGPRVAGWGRSVEQAVSRFASTQLGDA
jgi:hypothetical protein